MSIPAFEEIIEPNDQTAARAEHLAALKDLVGNAYPNKFERSRVAGDEDTITRIVNFEAIGKHVPQLAEGEKPSQEVKDAANAELKKFGGVRIAGRLATPPRVMGKAAFVHLSDGISRIQIYVRRDDVQLIRNVATQSDPPASALDAAPEKESPSATADSRPPAHAGGSDSGANFGWQLFKLLDHGDFIGVEGFLFITNSGELSVHVEKLQFLSKALLPMPDKMHGIEDAEIKQRRRYVDLIGSSLAVEHEGLTTREVFETRAKTISSLRRYLEDHGYIEVETPMLTPKATGAAAKPFETHHNALDIKLYARIAPELYLKRLLVGGFEKVYELNRNFRNEGISFKHNPEFTMLEFYCAYMDVNGMMDLCEEMFQRAVEQATGGLQVEYEGKTIDFSTMERLPMLEAVKRHAPGREVTVENMLELFEEFAEPKLIQPTFVIDYPKAISPLSKASPQNPKVAERFELFINGMEVANGFSELNDPREQYERFIDQMSERERGDEEAMVLDEDYVRALAYGMPPAAGIGIGVDRLVMLLTNKHSIRDVILFPHMRPERRAVEEQDAAGGAGERQ
jgi:lysyl-tRNA synthetase class 2